MEEPKYLEQFTTQELEAELEHRRNKRPERLPYANWTPIADYVMDALPYIDREKKLPVAFEHRLMELALETMYGEKIWEWWNRKLSGK